MNCQLRIKTALPREIFLVAVLFLGIFMPCLVRVRMQYILFALGLLFLLFQCLKDLKFHVNKGVVRCLLAFVPFLVYYSLLTASNILAGKDASLYLVEYKQILSLGLYVVVLGAAIMQIRQTEVTTKTFCRLIIMVSLAQLLFVALSLLSPSIKSFFNDLTIKNSYNETIVSVMKRGYYKSWRNYGLAENLFDGFGFVISILFSITLIYGLGENKIGIITLAGVMLVMPLVNARTGLVLCGISAVYIMLKYLNGKRLLIYILGIVVAAVLFGLLFGKLPQNLQVSVTEGFSQITDLFQGKVTGVFSELLVSDFVMPSNIWFGDGISPERLGSYSGIDSGYVQCLWRFGIFGTLLLFGGFGVSFGYAYRMNRNKKSRAILVSTLLIMTAYCFKLFFFTSYANVFLLFTVLFIAVIEGTWKNGKNVFAGYNSLCLNEKGWASL